MNVTFPAPTSTLNLVELAHRAIEPEADHLRRYLWHERRGGGAYAYCDLRGGLPYDAWERVRGVLLPLMRITPTSAWGAAAVVARGPWPATGPVILTDVPFYAGAERMAAFAAMTLERLRGGPAVPNVERVAAARALRVRDSRFALWLRAPAGVPSAPGAEVAVDVRRAASGFWSAVPMERGFVPFGPVASSAPGRVLVEPYAPCAPGTFAVALTPGEFL